jgi:tetratricopeptide (TPR) repeat protein
MTTKAGSLQIKVVDFPTLLLAALDMIKRAGLKIIEIRPQRSEPPPLWDPGSSIPTTQTFGNKEGWDDHGRLLIRAKPGLFGSLIHGVLEVVVSSDGVSLSARYGTAKYGAILQDILTTHEYPADGKQIVNYAKQRLEGAKQDRQRLFLEFLKNWVQFAETVRRLEGRIEEEPLNANAYFELAETIFRFGLQDSAKEHYLKALSLEPDPGVVGIANLRLGSIASQMRDDRNWNKARYRLEQSVAGFEKNLRRNPNDAQMWSMLASTYRLLGFVYGRLGKSRAETTTYEKSDEARARAEISESLTSAQETPLEARPIDKKGLAFEEKCLRLVRAMGFQAKTTKRSGDGGIDIVATSTQPLLAGEYVIQCKDWSAPVGVSPVRDLYGVVVGTRANKGILMSGSTFTKPAKDFAQGKQLELIDGEELEKLYQTHVDSLGGIVKCCGLKPPRRRISMEST